MAAQPNFWGILVNREGTPSGRVQVRRETNPAYWQRYRQSPPVPERVDIPADLFPEVLVESRLNPTIAAIVEERDVAETDSLSRILNAIDKLMSPDEDDGDLAATPHAYQSARAVVESAYGRLLSGDASHAERLPIPAATTDERGGVRLSWQVVDRHVRINFAATPDLRSYLYFESPAEHDIEALQPTALSARLDWMLNA